MSDVVIRAENLRKVYRLYTKPSYRFLDIFGVLGNRAGAFTEHAALDGVNLEIRRGEKVAIIGRNGAGKSTFLKLVTRVIEPTSGTLEVEGHVHALLQIGTGFHPEFTGRENVLAYLAQLGVVGSRAAAMCEEVIEFAELEEYIDQPVKTYSTGMAVRLMFSTSTTITPDLLVLDEVLGVGDAYFANKSFQRMKDLCESSGTTLLLVTHDIYSAINLCERVVWIDRGQVLIDGDGPSVVKAYEDSVRQQEESRLRVRKQQRLESARETEAVPNGAANVLVEIHSRGNRPQPCPVYFSAVELLAGDRVVASLPLSQEATDRPQGSHLEFEASTWGAPEEREGYETRPFLNYGSSFHKVAGIFLVPPTLSARLDALALRVHYWSEQPCDLLVRMFIDGHGVSLGALPPAAGSWMSHRISLSDASEDQSASYSFDGVQGTGKIVVDDVRMLDERGEETHVARHGGRVSFVVDYRIADPSVNEHAQFMLIFHRDGVQLVCRVITRDLLFDGATTPRGSVRLDIPKLALSDGSYAVSVFVARENYFDEPQSVFYSLNPGVYYSLNRVFDMTVVGGGLVAGGAVFVAEGEWSLVATEAPASR